MTQTSKTARRQAPVDGWLGFKKYLAADLSAGFAVFLLALPLSLGIAKASGVPPLMGVITAIIGGVVISFFTGARLTIKGPAAGLIVIVAGAVDAFGGGTTGWQLAAGVMVVAGVVQVLFGVLRWGRVVDFFPLAAIHGMLAAIGCIIIAKQLPVLLNIDPAWVAGKGPFQLVAALPDYLSSMDHQVTLVGVIAMAIMLFWARIPVLGKVPAPLVVLLVAVPLSSWWQFGNKPDYTLVELGSLLDAIAVNADFSGLSRPWLFAKYVVMLALIGSLESLLTVKSVDIMDPYRRWSDPDRDLVAIGIGNTFAAILGGIPMISAVARSSANVAHGAVTRWANFWHGAFLLVFVIVAYPLLELIPNTALAAMLIIVGWRLTHPRQFVKHWQIGWQQLVIFVVTIITTLLTDLLVGVAAGIVVKFLLHLSHGVGVAAMVKSPATLKHQNGSYYLTLRRAAVFTNYLPIKRLLDSIPDRQQVTIVADESLQLVDHTVINNLHKFVEDYQQTNGAVVLVGFDSMTAVSAHPQSMLVRR